VFLGSDSRKGRDWSANGKEVSKPVRKQARFTPRHRNPVLGAEFKKDLRIDAEVMDLRRTRL
jgi:hypothetical protein